MKSSGNRSIKIVFRILKTGELGESPRTLYTRTKRRGSMTSMDKKYQMLLEHALYSEMQYVLGISAAELSRLLTSNLAKI